MDSSSIESPLDVLSRAATMLRQNDRSGKPRNSVGKDVQPSARWRRDRRPCPLVSSSTPSRPIARPTPRSGQPVDMAPLDMSTRRKEVPAAIPLRLTKTRRGGSSQQTPRVSVITCAPVSSPSASSSEEEYVLGLESDPVIDEHFRRSLGRDYLALFPGAGAQKPSSQSAASPPPVLAKRPNSTSQQSSVAGNVTLTGLSVDDHFAKALGETWLRLQAREEKGEEKSKSTSKPKPSSTTEAQEHSPSSPATVIPLTVST